MWVSISVITLAMMGQVETYFSSGMSFSQRERSIKQEGSDWVLNYTLSGPTPSISDGSTVSGKIEIRATLSNTAAVLYHSDGAPKDVIHASPITVGRLESFKGKSPVEVLVSLKGDTCRELWSIVTGKQKYIRGKNEYIK